MGEIKKFLKLTVLATGLWAFGIGAQAQTVFSMQIIADNDFAVLAGTDSGITSLLYQNDSYWGDQLGNLSTLTFSLQPGETTFYLLGMGGGGVEENISGTINDIDITTIPVSMSSDIGTYLTNYESENDGGAVGDGSFNVNLSDVQDAFSSLTWGDPTYDNSQTVITSSPTGQGYTFPSNTAHLFKISSSDVNVTPTPEPSTAALLGLGGLLMLGILRRRKAAHAAA